MRTSWSRLRRSVWPLALTGALAGSLGVVPAGAVASTGTAGSQTMPSHPGYRERPVVSDIAGRAPLTDPNLRNPWGIAFGPTTPLWVANDGTATSTIYAGGVGGAPVSMVPLVVGTPRHPTGIVFNDTTGFRLPDGTPSRFVFASLGGTISGWPATTPPPTSATVLKRRKGAMFTGLALAHTRMGPRLFAADAAGGFVRVYNGRLHQVATLRDRHLPPKLAPYNVAVLRDKVYVTYSLPDGVSGKVEGAVDVFTTSGHLARRLITGGALRGPWGLAIAPMHWGRFSGDLLVGNEDGGRISAYNLRTGAFEGTLRHPDGTPVGRDGLWGMKFGNGVIGHPDDLVVAIGIDDYAHGLVEFIRPVG